METNKDTILSRILEINDLRRKEKELALKRHELEASLEEELHIDPAKDSYTTEVDQFKINYRKNPRYTLDKTAYIESGLNSIVPELVDYEPRLNVRAFKKMGDHPEWRKISECVSVRYNKPTLKISEVQA